MADRESLQGLLDQSVRAFPERPAVRDAAGSVTYRQMGTLSDRLRDRLVDLGVGAGDRVGIYLRKSVDSLAAIFAILKTGAAYVPVGPDVPAPRNAFVFDDCSVKAVIVEREFEPLLRKELSHLHAEPALVVLEKTGAGRGIMDLPDQADRSRPARAATTVATDPDDLAYVLYTSGSTGNPKGVMLTHRNALSFIDWCSSVFEPSVDDRFSSHAPFHFDLSILDIYVPIKHGAELVLIGEEAGKDPLRLAALIPNSQITVWYSTPSVLTMLTEYGHMEKHDYTSLRLVLFAGEVFPIKHFKKLKRLLPGPQYFNLYGPTETNVCTSYEVPSRIPDNQASPFPIGTVCSHLSGKVVPEGGGTARAGEEGELCIAGPAVMQGYWNRPEQTEFAFLTDADGIRWYRTGDIVVEEADGNYRFVGRRDRMVKRRGFRVELGEIEAVLYGHPAVEEVAVIAAADDEAAVRIKAFLNCPHARPSVIELKSYCAERLPSYMVPDILSFQPSLPKTSTDKIDYERLKDLS